MQLRASRTSYRLSVEDVIGFYLNRSVLDNPPCSTVSTQRHGGGLETPTKLKPDNRALQQYVKTGSLCEIYIVVLLPFASKSLQEINYRNTKSDDAADTNEQVVMRPAN